MFIKSVMKNSLVILAMSLFFVATYIDAASSPKLLQSPASGVVCDNFVCADAKEGISLSLTEKYLGKNKSKRLAAQGEFDHTQFTFANGIFCDVKERLCRKDRYYGVDGKRSGAVDKQATTLLFGQIE